MNELIYNVLCEINQNLIEVNNQLSDIKYEIGRISGVGDFKKDLYDIYDKLDSIESAVESNTQY